MPKRSWDESEEWTYELINEIHGKVVKVGYTDGNADNDTVIGIANMCDDRMRVTTKNGVDEWIDMPCQIYASSVRKWK